MTQPEDQQQPDIPRPPGWGQPPQQQPEYQPEQQPPAPDYGQYGPPQDPFHTTTMTPTSAQIPPFVPGPAPPQGKRNTALIVTAIALGVMLVLCAVGGVGTYFLLRDTDGEGAVTARDAAQGFLTAIYKDADAAEAEKLVCSEARDKKAIEAKINEIADQKSKLKSPSITWDTLKIANETTEQADTTVTVKLTTSDEKVSAQTLKLTLVKREGWFVCEVREQPK